MGNECIENYEQKFKEKGLTPLEPITSDTQKVECVDSEGYKYFLCYRGAISSPLPFNESNKWDRARNPFKAYNMRLLASKVQENVEILSTDEELMNSTKQKVTFRCPQCGAVYQKRWCHWIDMPKNEHFCQRCRRDISDKAERCSPEELKALYASAGFELLSPYDEYKGYLEPLTCRDSEGYLYYTSPNSINSGNMNGYNKFSISNKYAKRNLELYCDKNDINVKVKSIYKSRKICGRFICACGNEFTAEVDKLKGGQTRCRKCVNADSKYSLMTREWLDEHGIKYIKEYRFDDCRDKNPLPFDFTIEWKDSLIMIEVNGAHHYYVTQWNNDKSLEKQKLHDAIKREYCKSHGYKMVEIPYWLYRTDSYKQVLNETFFGED